MIQKARSELLLHPAKFEKPHNGATYECGQTSKKQDKHKFIGGNMLERKLTLPELGLLAGTRVALGIGIGLLLSGRLSDDQRKGAGSALMIMGALTTIPLVIGLISQKDNTRELRSVA
jgi:hypothetical protein